MPTLSQRDCDLLNNHLVPFDEIKFVELNRYSRSLRPVKSADRRPLFQSKRRSSFLGVYNRLPVLVKEVKLWMDPTDREPKKLPEYFSTECEFPMEQLRQLRDVIISLALPPHGALCRVYAWAVEPTTRASFFVVTEQFDETLENYLMKRTELNRELGIGRRPIDGGVLGWPQFFAVALDVCSALIRMSELKKGVKQAITKDGKRTVAFDEVAIIHRDLQPASLLLKLRPVPVMVDGAPTAGSHPEIAQVALGDFNVARMEGLNPYVPVENPTRRVGTLDYQPPEAFSYGDLDPEHRLCPKYDIYGFGVLLWQLIYGIESLPNSSLEGPAWKALPPALAELIQTCCSDHPGQRPSALEVHRDLSNLLQEIGEGYEEPLAIGGIPTEARISDASQP